ncbi:MAG: relaxase/mobilization nuclease domain-containing protein [Proteobacteria bacterium]|nr:relaxase/mobilization nuclease domain-containing protein [Pseudomonadota bacterium]MBU1586296.1 relaxase/mobilization nuclease domain-containing protein [Pseudomonadota bacterium]MBU2431862.1 relaxase/mobilization nuclease domain-containing protein [Pseudomonadota bacterium]MBU2453198.1 relaxase/mobilization nuclease domain-containing protein [Pseudomonadota bacterium]MBU2630775.1 relaxase/mobilization nuclease domain-containing protein [Pseudomonadota bacterium]
MIAEVLTRKKSRPFKGLADYLNGKPGRVETNFFINCSFDDPELNLKEIKALQTVARSEADKTYHFVISLREGEKLNNDEIRRVVNMHLKALGFENHQALVTAHNDTANFHIHVGVNKVCPETERTISPYKDFEKLDKTCGKLEKIFGLQQDNRIGQRTNKTKRLYDGRQSFQEWVSDLSPEIMNQVEKARSWSDLHTALAKYNLCIRQRGAGFVISDRDNKLFMKASAVDRKLSKKSLEDLLGSYEKTELRKLPKPDLVYEGIPKGVEKQNLIFTEFKDSEATKKQTRNEKLNILYDQHGKKILLLKDWYTDCKQDLQKDWFMAKRERNMVLNRHRQTMKEKLDQYYRELQTQKSEIIRKTSPVGWKTFVLNEAQKGRGDALYILRNKPKKLVSSEKSFSIIKRSKIIAPGFNKVSGHGELIYTFGKVQLRDAGNKLNFFGDFSDEKGLVEALKLVSTNYDKSLVINGSHLIKRNISDVIHRNKIDLEFMNFKVNQGRGAEKQDRGR